MTAFTQTGGDMAKLYLVGTPIGNLEDITLRALSTLRAVDFIACEDTRHSNILLQHFDIKKPTFSLHKFNEKAKLSQVLKLLREGKEVAYISDAGMPIVSDPGFELLKAVRAAGFESEVIPGISAITTAVVGCGLDSTNFTFLGFLPQQTSHKRAVLEKFANLDTLLVIYVSSHDLKAELDFLFQVLGSRKVVLARELTKKFEEYTEGMLGEMEIGTPRGEYVVLVEGIQERSPLNELPLKQHLQLYLDSGQSKMDAMKQVAKDRGVAKSEIYRQCLEEEK